MMTLTQREEMTRRTINSHHNVNCDSARHAVLVTEVAHVLGLRDTYHTQEFVHFPKNSQPELMERSLVEGKLRFQASF